MCLGFRSSSHVLEQGRSVQGLTVANERLAGAYTELEMFHLTVDWTEGRPMDRQSARKHARAGYDILLRNTGEKAARNAAEGPLCL